MSFCLQGNEIIALLRRVVTIMIINYERDHNKTCRIESEIEIMFFNTYFFQYFIFRPSTSIYCIVDGNVNYFFLEDFVLFLEDFGSSKHHKITSVRVDPLD